jgi:hypothetical protein
MRIGLRPLSTGVDAFAIEKSSGEFILICGWLTGAVARSRS